MLAIFYWLVFASDQLDTILKLHRVNGFYESYENPEETIIEFVGGDMVVSPKKYHEVKQILGIEPPGGEKPTIRLNLN